MKTDTLFYSLFQHHPKLALELLGLDYDEKSYRFGSEEIKQTAFRVDGIFTPLVDNPEQPLIFAEVQCQADDDFYDRLFSEITLYLRVHKPKHKWLALVIYPTRKLERQANIAFQAFMDLPQLHRIYLEDYKIRKGVSPTLDLLSLISCTKKKTMMVARDLVNSYDEIDAEILDFIETILVYKLPTLSREEIKEMLGLDDVKLKDTRFYQEIAEENTQIMLQRALTHRFGDLPPQVLQRLKTANAKQLDQWFIRSLDASSLDGVFEEQIH